MKSSQSFPEKQQSPLFDIQPFRTQMQAENFPDPVQCHLHECKIVWVTKGTGKYDDGYTITPFKPGVLFCLHHTHQKITPDKGAAGFVISFGDRLLNMEEIERDLICQANVHKLFSGFGGLLIEGELETDLADLVARMTKENAQAGVFKIEVLKRYLKIFFIYLTREFSHALQPVASTKAMEYVDRFMNMLEQNFRSKKMVSDYAGCLFVTPNYLNEVVKKATGYSASHHIRQRIVVEAKRMALCSDHSMKEIAYSLGFIDCAHFSKFFKALAGDNFTEFKNQKLAIRLAV